LLQKQGAIKTNDQKIVFLNSMVKLLSKEEYPVIEFETLFTIFTSYRNKHFTATTEVNLTAKKITRCPDYSYCPLSFNPNNNHKNEYLHVCRFGKNMQVFERPRS